MRRRSTIDRHRVGTVRARGQHKVSIGGVEGRHPRSDQVPVRRFWGSGPAGRGVETSWSFGLQWGNAAAGTEQSRAWYRPKGIGSPPEIEDPRPHGEYVRSMGRRLPSSAPTSWWRAGVVGLVGAALFVVGLAVAGWAAASVGPDLWGDRHRHQAALERALRRGLRPRRRRLGRVAGRRGRPGQRPVRRDGRRPADRGEPARRTRSAVPRPHRPG